MKRQRIYIAGPMSGLPGSNYDSFHDAAAKLRNAGYEVENPAETRLPAGTEWALFMREGISSLMACDGLALLPGWWASRGAKIEYNLALNLGLVIRRAGEWLYPDRTSEERSMSTGWAEEPLFPVLSGGGK